MKVTRVYLDLKEGKQSDNVWLLESEAFKEPIKLDIEIDDKEISEMLAIKQECENIKKETQNILDEINKAQKSLYKTIEELNILKNDKIELLNTYQNALKEVKLSEKAISKANKTNLKTVEDLSGDITRLNEKINQFKENSTCYFEGKEFIGGLETYFGKKLDVTSGRYLIIKHYKVFPKNEYVDYYEDTEYEVREITDGYNPSFKLKSKTELDKPVAEIEFNILFLVI